MKNLILNLFLFIFLFLISCKPEYIAPTFTENRIKYIISIDTLSENNVRLDTTEFIYDDLNRIAKIIIHIKDDVYNFITYKYKSNFVLQTKYTYYDIDKKQYLKEEIKYFFDENNNIIKCSYYNEILKKTNYYDFKYNSNNNIIAFYRNDTLIEEYKYTNSILISINDFEANIEKKIIYNQNKNNLSFYFYNLSYSKYLSFFNTYIFFSNQLLPITIKEIQINT
jgi:hypothetical protein